MALTQTLVEESEEPEEARREAPKGRGGKHLGEDLKPVDHQVPGSSTSKCGLPGNLSQIQSIFIADDRGGHADGFGPGPPIPTRLGVALLKEPMGVTAQEPVDDDLGPAAHDDDLATP